MQISLKQIIIISYKYKTNGYLYGCKNTSHENKTRKIKASKTSFHENQNVFGAQNLLGPKELGTLPLEVKSNAFGL